MKKRNVWMGIGVFVVLTLLTQIGGFVWLAAYALRRRFLRGSEMKRAAVAEFSLFLGLYVITSLCAVPALARAFGRVPMPCVEGVLQPQSAVTCVLNRHYVRPTLLSVATDVARETARRFPGTRVTYLDANFPFLDGFPLLPHQSHNDGKKLDLAFLYRADGEPRNGSPSWIGYGVFEGPRPGEEDRPAFCAEHGYLQYGMLRIVGIFSDASMHVDAARTTELIRLFSRDRRVGKLFLEPHLVTRWGVAEPKMRFHGCGAVRHDDHLHIQLF